MRITVYYKKRRDISDTFTFVKSHSIINKIYNIFHDNGEIVRIPIKSVKKIVEHTNV